MTERKTLTRKQQKKEADDLAALLSFAPEFVGEARLRDGNARGLLDHETAAFETAYQRLTRELYRRARAGRVTPSLAEVAEKVREPLQRIAVFEKLGANRGLEGVKLTQSEIADLASGLELIQEIVRIATARRSNLKTGRTELEKKISTNTEFRRLITDTRAENARTAVRKRPKAAAELGGQKGGPARAEKLSDERKKEIGALGKKAQMENLAARIQQTGKKRRSGSRSKT